MLPNVSQGRLARALGWGARLTSVWSIATLALFVAGEPPVPGRVAAADWVGFAFFPVGVVAGMVVAWRRDGLGAAIGLASLAGFYLVYGLGVRHSVAMGWWFTIFSSPLALFLLAWVVRLQSRHPHAGPRAVV